MPNFLNNSFIFELWNYLWFRQSFFVLLAIVGIWLILEIIKVVVLGRLKNWAQKTDYQWDDQLIATIQQVGWPVYILLALFFVSQFQDFHSQLQTFISGATLIAVTFYVIRIVQVLLDQATNSFFKRQDKSVDKTSQIVIRNVLKVGVWLLAVVLVLQNLGVNITALLGGLGLAGIAIGFALQQVLGDIFSFFAIYFDKPFAVGDFITVGTDKGVVKKVGLRSTRITTLEGQELVVSNQELTSSRINNFKKMQKRRVSFAFGVTYGTSPAKLRKIPELVTEIFDGLKLAELDRVHLNKLGDYSIDYEVVYFMNSTDYVEYMDSHQELNLQLVEVFAKEKIEFAYPTQEVVVKKA